MPSVRSAGFTLVELLVVMAILGLLLGVSIPAYNTYNNSQKLQQTRDTIVETLRDAQTRATSGEIANSATGTSLCPSGLSFDGYYAKIDPSNGNNTSMTVAASCSSTTSPSQTVSSTSKTFSFPDSSVTLTNIQYDGSSNSPNTSEYIVFRPVAQNVSFFSGVTDFRSGAQNTAGTNHTLSFQIQRSGASYTIKVTSFGEINAQ